MRLLHICTLFLFFSISEVNAQHEGTMPFMTGLSQVSNYNPAFVPKYKVAIGLPFSSIYAQYANNSFRASDFITDVNGESEVDISKLSNALRDKNYLTVAGHAEILRLGIKLHPRMYFSYSLQAKTYSRVMLPKGLVNLLDNGLNNNFGNNQLISPEIETLAYLESAWSASYAIDKNLTIGASLKFLNGLANATSKGTTATLSSGSNGLITARATLNAKTSGLESAGDLELENYRDYLVNNGFAFDIGATYRFFDKLTVGVSALDIGSIKWKRDTYEYELNPNDFSVSFRPLNLEDILNDDDSTLEALADSVEGIELVDAAIGEYKTFIPSRFYLTANYSLRKNLSVGAALFAERFRGRFSPAFSASLHKEFGRRAGFSLSYSATNRSFDNIGAGFNINFAPIQFYMVADNLLRIPIDGDTDRYIENTRFFNLRLGINLIFGRVVEQEKLPSSHR